VNLIDLFQQDEKQGEIPTYSSIRIYTQDKDEPLYLDLERRRNDVTIEETYDSIPDVDELEKGEHHHLICFDDMLLEKDQKKIEKFFNRGRKKNISIIYLSQAYAQSGASQLPSIRKNANYVVLFQLSENVDNVLKNFNYYDDFDLVMVVEQLPTH
jgi:hypothetical protein